jgi:hypothetical protein
MRLLARSVVTTAVVAVIAIPAAAQQVVGRLPAQSSLQDLNDGQRFGLFTGWLTTGLDPVGVRAHSAPIAGVRYDLLMGAPAYLSMRLYGIKSSHDVADPNRPQNDRFNGTASDNQLGADASVEVSLTGERTWHGVQPLTRLGLGFISGVGNHFDLSRFAPGTSVVYLYGLGARWPVGKNADFRVDANWMVYQVRYPAAYRLGTAADTVPLRGTGGMTPQTTNRAITASWTWGIFR